MTVRDALRKTTTICYPTDGRPVELTVADALRTHLAPQARIIADCGSGNPKSEIQDAESEEALHIFVADGDAGSLPRELNHKVPTDADWMLFQMASSGRGRLVASRAHLLYPLYIRVLEDWLDEDVDRFSGGEAFTATFRWCPDALLIREMTYIGRGFDRESYVRECARLGYSHMAVNGLASLSTMEPWTPGEVYPLFYRYNAALDQFVASRLNKGIYPEDYLEANLNILKRNAALVVRYGMTPGLISFEPRSVPDELLRRYPMLRGARVDHPFRSFKPRYNLSIAHPVVRDHYAELIHNLLEEVPELGYLVIHSNDSGAGFEHTQTLYAGRNGGAYLIREWKMDEEIAQAAGQNAVRFVRVLRDAAQEIHPGFRVILSMGPFRAERPTVWAGLGEGVDAQDSLSSLSREDREELQKRGAMPHISAPVTPNFGPLIGIPSPWLTYENIERLAQAGVDVLAYGGEVAPPSLAPWCVNHEVLRAMQLSRPVDIDAVVMRAARGWVGPELANRLVEAWRLTDTAIRAYTPLYLYGDFGFVPYRLWVRPLVPDIERISEEDRVYYERFLLSISNNPTRVDLSRDVLFELNTPDEALEILQRMDAGLWKPLDEAIQMLSETLMSLSESEFGREVLLDQRDRLRALRCWFRTQRSTAAWIAGVPGYLQAKDERTRTQRRQLLRDMVTQEIENTRDLLELWENSPVHFMGVSSAGENTFMYGENFGDLLRRRIELMQGRENDEPYIDPDFIWRVPGMEWESLDAKAQTQHG